MKRLFKISLTVLLVLGSVAKRANCADLSLTFFTDQKNYAQSNIEYPVNKLTQTSAESQVEIVSNLHALIPRAVHFGHFKMRAFRIDSANRLKRELQKRRLSLLGKLPAPAQNPQVELLGDFVNSPYDSNPAMQYSQRSPGQRFIDRQVGYDKEISVYMRATSDIFTVGNQGNTVGFKTRSIGAFFGFDMRVTENIILGFAASYEYDRAVFNRHLGGGHVKSYRLGPYMLLYSGEWFASTEATFALHTNTFARRTIVPGQNAQSYYASQDFSYAIGGGRDIDLGIFTLTPQAKIQYQFYHANGFTETCVPNQRLKVSEFNSNSLSTIFSVDLWKHIEINEPWLKALSPFFTLGWHREWMGDPHLQRQLIEEGDVAFNSNNNLFSSDTVFMEIGSTFEIDDSLIIDMRYTASIGYWENSLQSVSFNVRYRF